MPGPLEEIILKGGRANVGNVVRIGDQVARPSYPQTATVNHFLQYLTDAAGTGPRVAPVPLGTDDQGRQRLSFVPGTAPTPPFPAWAFDEELLVRVASYQVTLHSLARRYEPPADAIWAVSAGDYFPPQAFDTEDLIVCHNDLGMTNVIVDDRRTVVGFIDFDYCRPVDRLFDIAVAARHWVPFGDLDLADGTQINRLDRFRLFCEVHDLDRPERRRVIELATAFLDHALRNVSALAAGGHAGFAALLAEGYEETNRATVQWLDENAEALANV